MPQISIIIPTRNRCELLLRAIESARRAARSIEIVVVDDASEDQTPEVCRGLPDVRYIRVARRLGVSGARNVGLIASTSEYISFLDDDDLRLPGTIDTQVSLLADRPEAGMVYGGAMYGDQDCRPAGGSYPEKFPQGDVFWQLMIWNFIPCPTVVFRRDCLLRVGLLDDEAAGIEDWDLWIRIAEIYPVLALEQAVAVWRRPTPQSNQFTSRADRMHDRTFRWHKDKWLKLPRVRAAGTDRRRRISRSFADRATQQLIWEGAARLKDRDLRNFLRIVSKATRLYPLTFAMKTFSLGWSSVRRESQVQTG